MAPKQAGSNSFDDIVQAGRQKKRNETLAQEILGRGRKGNASHLGVQTSAGRGSLASRISKQGPRSASSSGVRPNFRQTLKRAQSTTQIERGVTQRALLRQALDYDVSPSSEGFSIKGKAGPYVVVGSNFAPGTSSADIQASMEPVGGEMFSCMVISASPTVIAEMVFETKNGADAVIARFNNQRADGRLLHLYHKNGPPATEPLPSANTSNGLAGRITGAAGEKSRPREEHREVRAEGDKIHRQAEPEVQDGSYGFASNEVEVGAEMEQDPRPHYDERPSFSGGRNDYNRNNGRYNDGRDRYQSASRGGRDTSRSYDYRAQRGDRGLYSDKVGGSNQERRYR